MRLRLHMAYRRVFEYWIAQSPTPKRYVEVLDDVDIGE